MVHGQTVASKSLTPLPRVFIKFFQIISPINIKWAIKTKAKQPTGKLPESM